MSQYQHRVQTITNTCDILTKICKCLNATYPKVWSNIHYHIWYSSDHKVFVIWLTIIKDLNSIIRRLSSKLWCTDRHTFTWTKQNCLWPYLNTKHSLCVIIWYIYPKAWSTASAQNLINFISVCKLPNKCLWHIDSP